MLLVASFVAAAPVAWAATVEFDLYGSESEGWGFTSGSMTIPGPDVGVDEGDDVTIDLFSADSLPHLFFIDYDGDGTADSDEPQSTLFTDSTTLMFTADVPGTFTYFCSVHPATMYGSWDTVAGPEPVHDVAITAVSASPLTVVQGDPVTITVTAANEGDVSETTTVTAYAGALTVASQSATIPAGGSQSMTFTWDTTSVSPGDYLVRAEASAVPGETDLDDNELSDGMVTVEAPPPPPPGPGDLKAELVRRSGWPDRHHFVLSRHGPSQTLFGLVRNTGPGPVVTKVVFTISDRDTGVVVGTVESSVLTLAVDGMQTVQASWTAVVGRYSVIAQCVYDTNSDGTFDGADTDVKTFSFTVVP